MIRKQDEFRLLAFPMITHQHVSHAILSLDSNEQKNSWKLLLLLFCACYQPKLYHTRIEATKHE